jgi:hypothetical protein
LRALESVLPELVEELTELDVNGRGSRADRPLQFG